MTRARREFLFALAALAAGARSPLARADGSRRLGFVSPTAPGPTFDAFRAGMVEAGYAEGTNLVIESRFAQGQFERFPGLIAEVLGRNVEVIVVGSSAGVLAAKKATSRVPIVFAGVFDPVGIGAVRDFARPEGNVTGVTMGVGGTGFAGKWVELLREAFPRIGDVAVLSNPRNGENAATALRDMQAAAGTLNVRLVVVPASDPLQLENGLATIGRSGAAALVVTNDPLFFTHRLKLVRFAADRRMPAVYFTEEFVQAGGLMSYGANLAQSYRKAASYVARIFGGAKPADLPIQQPTRVELVVNRKTARAMGMDIPRSILLRADKVIE